MVAPLIFMAWVIPAMMTLFDLLCQSVYVVH
jgi:hypothetical protein